MRPSRSSSESWPPLRRAWVALRGAWHGAPGRNRRFALAALAYVALVLASAAPLRLIVGGARAALGAAFGPTLNAMLVLAVAAWLWRCRAALWPPVLWRLSGLVGLALAYGAAVWALPVPEERFHLLQYGALAWLVSEALDAPPTLAGLRRHAMALGLVTLVGAADEALQWLLPNRVGDWRDVGINAVAALLAQGLLACTLPRAEATAVAAESRT